MQGRQGSRGRQPPGGGAGAEPPQGKNRIRGPFPGKNLKESAPVRMSPVRCPLSVSITFGSRARAPSAFREWNAHGRGNSAASRVQGLCSVFAHFRKRDRARNRGHIGGPGDISRNRVPRPRHGRNAKKVAETAVFNPTPGPPSCRGSERRICIP